MPESRTSPRRLKAKDRQLQALELRKEGYTFDAIAKRLGYRGRQSAAMAVEAALKAIVLRPAEEVRKLDLERLDEMLRSLMTRIRMGDPQAVHAAIRVMERRAKLLGLDMPIRIEGEIEHLEKRDYTRVPEEQLQGVLAQAEAVLNDHAS